MRAALPGIVLLAACATPLDHLPASDLPSAAHLESVPFYEQRHDDCGAASLAMVLSWSGVQVDRETLLEEVYTASLSGALPADLVGASRRHGRVPYPVDDLDGVLREVAAGRPVLVLQNLAFGWSPVWHYAVVVGYDLDASSIALHTGARAGRAVSLGTFDRTWQRADHWAQVILPPDEFSLSSNDQRVLQAGVALEQAGRLEEAEKLYAAAASRWPRSLAARLGLGNSRYARGNLSGAEAAFRQAIAVREDSAAAHNNLAQVLLEKGDLEGARIAADRAVALGGPLSSTYRETRRAIETARPPEPGVEDDLQR